MLTIATVDFSYITIFSTPQSEADWWQKTLTTLYWKDLPCEVILPPPFQLSDYLYLCTNILLVSQEEFPPLLYAGSHPLQRLAHRDLLLF